MRTWVYLLAAAGWAGAVGEAGAQGLRALPPAVKDGKEAAAADNSADIVVTATRRSQRLSTVPIAVSAYGMTALSHSGATDIRQMAQLSPSLLVSSAGSEAGAAARLRGIGTVGDNPGLESSVAVFIDGVYRNRSGAGLNDIGEVDRIEVLRGPQGTLSGRNSAAGAISVYTKYPSFTPGGYGEASFGNYGAVRLAGALTGPLVKDRLAFRIDGVAHRRTGFLYDVVNRTDFNDRRRAFLRGQLFFKPSDDLSLRLIGDYSYRREKCCGAVYIDTREKYDPTPGVPGDFAYAPQNRIVTVMREFGAEMPSARNPYNRRIAQTPGKAFAATVKDYGLSSRIGYTFGNVQLISITSYREYRAGMPLDYDFSNLDITYRDEQASSRFHTYTHETRLSGAAFGNRVDWLVGGYFAHETLRLVDSNRFGSQYGAFAACSVLAALNPDPAIRDIHAPACLNPARAEAARARRGAAIMDAAARLSDLHDVINYRDVFDQTSDNFAFFTHEIVRLTDRLSLTGGLRYTNERKTLRAALNSGNTTCGVQQANLAPLLADADPSQRRFASVIIRLSCPTNSGIAFNDMPLRDSLREGQFTGTAVLSWQARPSTLFYASYARGYKAGGYNLARAGLPDTAYLTPDRAGSRLRFDPETVQAIEIGAKYSVAKFNASVAAFRSTFRDFQLNTFNGTAFVVQNIGGCNESLHGADRDDSSLTGECHVKVGPGVITQGVEIEAGAYPRPDVTFGLGYTYAHTQYRRNLVGSAAGDPLSNSLFLLPGNQVSNAPRHVVTGSASWTPTIGHAGLTGLVYADSRLTSDYTTASDLFPERRQDGYVLVNARVGVRGRGERWALELWAQNLLDTRYVQIAGSTYLQGRGGQAQVQQFGAPSYATANALSIAFLGEPRTYGITLRSRF